MGPTHTRVGEYAFGGGGGICTRVQNTFPLLHTTIPTDALFGFEPCSSLVDLRFPQC